MTDREMDELIAEYIMGWNSYDWPVRRGDRYWSPSTNIADAWEVLNFLSESGYYICVERGRDWRAWVGHKGATAKTATSAICIAALAGLDL